MEYTDIADAFINKKRIRTQSYRGSLLVTSSNVSLNTNELDYQIVIAPISYTSSIKSIGLAAKTDLDCSISLHLLGIDQNCIYYIYNNPNDQKPSQDKLIYKDFEVNSLSFTEILPPEFSMLTLSDILRGEPTYDKYKNDRYGFLGINIKDIKHSLSSISNPVEVLDASEGVIDPVAVSIDPLEAVNLAEGSNDKIELYFQIQYVDGAPSSCPLPIKTVSSEPKKDG